MLPKLYAKWMDEFLPGPIPEEEQATCANCAMVPGDDRPSAGGGYFHPDVKCCSFLPMLPNFTVGRILADDDPGLEFGRTTTRARLRQSDGVTPLGIDLTRRYNLMYQNSHGFGQARELRCPHYMPDSGGCGIWPYRNGVCTTWYCKFNRGSIGERFWHALEAVLNAVEVDLIWWAVTEVDPGVEALRALLELRDRLRAGPRLSITELEGTFDSAFQRRVWGNWFEREEEFYAECARRVSPLSWEEALSICEPMVRARARVLEDEYSALMSQEVPDRLTLGKFTVLNTDGQRTLVQTYRDTDPLSLSSTLFRVLPHFDGRQTDQIVGEIVARERMLLRPEVLRRLADYQVLVPPPPDVEPAE